VNSPTFIATFYSLTQHNLPAMKSTIPKFSFLGLYENPLGTVISNQQQYFFVIIGEHITGQYVL
jgi:hypothetical protein